MVLFRSKSRGAPVTAPVPVNPVQHTFSRQTQTEVVQLLHSQHPGGDKAPGKGGKADKAQKKHDVKKPSAKAGSSSSGSILPATCEVGRRGGQDSRQENTSPSKMRSRSRLGRLNSSNSGGTSCIGAAVPAAAGQESALPRADLRPSSPQLSGSLYPVLHAEGSVLPSSIVQQGRDVTFLRRHGDLHTTTGEVEAQKPEGGPQLKRMLVLKGGSRSSHSRSHSCGGLTPDMLGVAPPGEAEGDNDGSLFRSISAAPQSLVVPSPDECSPEWTDKHLAAVAGRVPNRRLSHSRVKAMVEEEESSLRPSSASSVPESGSNGGKLRRKGGRQVHFSMDFSEVLQHQPEVWSAHPTQDDGSTSGMEPAASSERRRLPRSASAAASRGTGQDESQGVQKLLAVDGMARHVHKSARFQMPRSSSAAPSFASPLKSPLREHVIAEGLGVVATVVQDFSKASSSLDTPHSPSSPHSPHTPSTPDSPRTPHTPHTPHPKSPLAEKALWKAYRKSIKQLTKELELAGEESAPSAASSPGCVLSDLHPEKAWDSELPSNTTKGLMDRTEQQGPRVGFGADGCTQEEDGSRYQHDVVNESRDEETASLSRVDSLESTEACETPRNADGFADYSGDEEENSGSGGRSMRRRSGSKRGGVRNESSLDPQGRVDTEPEWNSSFTEVFLRHASARNPETCVRS